jgi:hypothetical protein
MTDLMMMQSGAAFATDQHLMPQNALLASHISGNMVMGHVGGHVIGGGDGFGSSASSINSGLALDGNTTPRNVRQRKDSNFRESDVREFERYGHWIQENHVFHDNDSDLTINRKFMCRLEPTDEWDCDLSDWGGLPPQPLEQAGKRGRALDFSEILEERTWRESRRLAVENCTALQSNCQARVQLLSNFTGPVNELPILHTELAFGDGFGGHLARYPMFAAAPHPSRHDLREPLSQRGLMLGGISSGTILRGEVTDVYQGGASLKMSFFMNGRLFEGNLSAQQPTVKSSVNHTPSGPAFFPTS